jgi:hypothetical protein
MFEKYVRKEVGEEGGSANCWLEGQHKNHGTLRSINSLGLEV